TVRIWSAETGLAIGKPLKGHTSRVTSVAYSPDGKQIVSGSGDKTLRIWTAYMAIPTKVPSVIYSLNAQHILSEGWIKLPHQQLILWVPHQYRHGLADPQQILTIP
ncbi:hypothetical protein BT96DRAFT_759420, partial [Gymnopus androsaceus JB14]